MTHEVALQLWQELTVLFSAGFNGLELNLYEAKRICYARMKGLLALRTSPVSYDFITYMAHQDSGCYSAMFAQLSPEILNRTD